MKKLIVGVLVVSALFFLGGCAADTDTGGAEPPNKDEAVTKAQTFYNELKSAGYNFSAGPCLTNNLFEDEEGLWALDVVHAPRTEVDDRPENQCSRYRAGDAKYLVELDVDGNLVSVQ